MPSNSTEPLWPARVQNSGCARTVSHHAALARSTAAKPNDTDQLPLAVQHLTGAVMVLTMEKIATILPIKQSATIPSREKFVGLPVVSSRM
jgi:hypothetical protein